MSLGLNHRIAHRAAFFVWTVLLLTLSAGRAEAQGETERFPGRSEDWNLRTNLLWAATAEPNLGFELAVGEHWTVGGNFGLKAWPRWLAWDWDKEKTARWRNFAIVPEVRWWRQRLFEGWFAGADLVYTHFNVSDLHFPFGMYKTVRDYRLQGDFAGTGLFGGYSWRLGGHWRIEAEAGLAVGYYRAGRYACTHCGNRLGTDKGVALVPKLGLNLSWGPASRKAEKLREEFIDLTIPEEPDSQEPTEELEEAFEPVEPEMVAPTQDETPAAREEMAVLDVHPIFTHPIVHNASEYVPYTPDRVLRKEKGATPVFFEYDRAVIKEKFTEGARVRDNSSVLEEILAVAEMVLSDTTLQISRIQVIGLASVEGSVRHNQQLSERRARALQRYIQEHLPVPDDRFETIGGGEAWTEMRDMLGDLLNDEDAAQEAGLSHDQIMEMVSIIDEEKDLDLRETRLKALSGGKVFKALNEWLLQDLRNSGYIRVYVDN